MGEQCKQAMYKIKTLIISKCTKIFNSFVTKKPKLRQQNQYHFVSIIVAKTRNLDDGKCGQGYKNLILAGGMSMGKINLEAISPNMITSTSRTQLFYSWVYYVF